MAANAAAGYVVPIGNYLGTGITGGKLKPYPDAETSMFDIYHQGNLDPRGAFAAPQDAWNLGRTGYGTIAAPDVLNAAAQETQNRYLGDPSTGQAGWSDRWNAWNAGAPQTDPNTGQTYYSPLQLTGERMNQGYGGRDQSGNPINPIMSNTNQGFTYMQNLLASNPDLNTGNIMSGYNQQMQNSPYSAPNLSAYVQAIQPANGVGATANITNNGAQAIHALGTQANFDQFGNQLVSGVQGLNQGTNFDQYGQRGVDQTNALDTANLQQLTGNIDTSAQQSLANQLQGTQQSMEAMGLGRSGAGQMAMLQNQAQILAQANRDKQSVLADFTNKNADRGAQAINLATQQGYGGQGQQFGAMNNALQNQAQLGYGGAGQAFGANVGAINAATQYGAGAQNQWSGLQGQAALQAMQGQQQFNTIGQQGMSNLYGQTMANANQRYGVDTGNYLNSLQGSQQLINQQNQMQANGQSQGLADWLGLQASRDQSQSSSMNNALTTANAQRAIQQDQRNQMMQYAMQPYNNMMTIATGTQPNAAPVAQPNFWQTGLASAIPAAAYGGAQWLVGSNQPQGIGQSLWGQGGLGG